MTNKTMFFYDTEAHISICGLWKGKLQTSNNKWIGKNGTIKEHNQSEVQTLCCASCNSKNFPTAVMPTADVLLHIAYGPIPNERK
jgi:hypothetical protein